MAGTSNPVRTTPPAALPPLPHWETTPADLPAAIREVKRAIRGRIAASGRTVEEVFAVVEARVRAAVEDIVAATRRGEPVWPVIDYADIAAGTVGAKQLALLRRRGCLVVRGHFPREQALAWDRDIIDYVEANGFFETYRGRFQPVGLPRGALRARLGRSLLGDRSHRGRTARPRPGLKRLRGHPVTVEHSSDFETVIGLGARSCSR